MAITPLRLIAELPLKEGAWFVAHAAEPLFEGLLGFLLRLGGLGSLFPRGLGGGGSVLLGAIAGVVAGVCFLAFPRVPGLLRRGLLSRFFAVVPGIGVAIAGFRLILLLTLLVLARGLGLIEQLLYQLSIFSRVFEGGILSERLVVGLKGGVIVSPLASALPRL